MVTSKAVKVMHLSVLALGSVSVLLASDVHSTASWSVGIPGAVAAIWALTKVYKWID